MPTDTLTLSENSKSVTDLFVDFTAPDFEHGRITNARTGEFFQFHLNPAKIKEKIGVNIAKDDIPGASDPLLRFASGAAKVITFDLPLNGEIQIRRRGQPFKNRLTDTLRQSPYSVDEIVEFFESFNMPVDPEELGSDGGNDKVLFTFARRYRGVKCVMGDLGVDQEGWSSWGDLMRATLNIELTRYYTTTVYSNQVWAP